MPPESPRVLLATPPHVPSDDLRELLSQGGFEVISCHVGTGDRLDFPAYSAIVLVVGSVLAPAAAQTRLWKAEMEEDAVPIIWVLPFESGELTVAGLDAGAEAVLARPVDPAVLGATLRAMVRVRRQFRELAGRAAEVREVNHELQRAYSQIDAAIEMTRKIQRALLPRQIPELERVRFFLHHRSRSRVGGDLYDIARLDESHVGFWLADPGGPGSPAGGLLGLVVKQAIRGKEITDAGYRLVPPDEVLQNVNRELLQIELEPSPLVGFAYGQLDWQTGRVAVSRGGLPAPVYLPASGPAETWVGPGAFLGSFSAEFPTQWGHLRPGDRLLLVTDGGADAIPWATIVENHRDASGQAFADAIALEVLSHATEPDDLTVLVIEAM